MIDQVWKSKIENIYVLSNFEKENYEIKSTKTKVRVIKDENPTSSISINTALSIIKEEKINPDAFLIASKEVSLTKKNIENLTKKIKYNSHLLVAGYKFRTKNKKLNNDLKRCYANKNLIAYQVPWNTCAMWSYKLFTENISKFDEITANNPFEDVCVSIDGVCYKTKHQGMEEGLAIAQAKSKNRELSYKLIDEDPLEWVIKETDVQRNREKLARKDVVMRNFMALRNYSVEDLVS